MQRSLLIILVLLQFAASGQGRVGYVDTERVIPQLPEHDLVMKKLESLKQSFSDSLQVYQQRYENFMKWLMRDMTVDSLRIKKLNDSLQQCQLAMYTYREQALQRMQREEQATHRQLNKHLAHWMRRFIEERKLDCIAEKQALLMGKDAVDMSDELIKFVQAGR